MTGVLVELLLEMGAVVQHPSERTRNKASSSGGVRFDAATLRASW